MDPTACQQPPMVLPSSHPLPRSFLSQTVSWIQSRASELQREMPRRMPRTRPNHMLASALGTQRSREPSSKQFLSEDKMAARFNSLSLDSDHMYSSNGFPVREEDPEWQQAYARLKELQRRLSQDSVNEAATEEENEWGNVVVDGEFLMPDCPLRTLPSFLQGPLGGVSLIPEEEPLHRSCPLEPSWELCAAHHPDTDGSPIFFGRFHTTSAGNRGDTRRNGNMSFHPSPISSYWLAR
ncbi:host cell factor C1 regulator 1 isoform X3 [Paroedura picta]|uniref:host cell factor C1 regulator 1 isoform X3 n=1 Tax=Paroedura picta TaxID=143630 RepID=UPI004056223F